MSQFENRPDWLGIQIAENTPGNRRAAESAGGDS